MSAFAEDLHEVFERFGHIQLKRMFGGHGVFRDGLMFGLVIQDRLYLKTDAQTEATFTAKQLAPFEYERQGKIAKIAYYEPPPEFFEDRYEAARWANLAWDAALRAQAAKIAKAAKKTTAKTSKSKTTAAAKKAKARSASTSPKR